MTTEEQARWRRAGDIFDAIADLPRMQRQARLVELCGDDEGLRAKVERLLAADASQTEPFTGDGARWSLAMAAGSAPDAEAWRGRRIGAWQIVGVLGHGGMGVVYEVRRDDQAYDQRAALKLIRIGADTPVVRERFLRERQTLAQLQHPNIASLIDGGFTDDGDPWFVMEYVDGQPIDTWCDAHALDQRARTELFGQVLDAVQYAHRNLVVHRDLKPSNILVDDAGRVKLLDFGVAKQLQGSGDATVGARALTLEYASPEQLNVAPITTATDIWQLGVVLYRLLCGVHPFGITQDTPLPRQLEQLGREPDTRALQGDLAGIVRGCLQRAPEHRYPSVDALAEDLARWRTHRPLRVSSPGPWRRATLWLLRNRGLAAATAGITIAVLAGTAASLWQAAEARRQGEHAQEALQVVGDVLSAAAPQNAMSHQVSVRELLDKARQELDQRNPPLAVRQPVQRMLGGLAQSVGEWRLANELLSAGLDKVEPGNDTDALRLAEAWHDYATSLGSSELGEESLAAAQRSATLRRAHGNAKPEQEFLALGTLAYGHYYADRGDEAHALWQQAITMADGMAEPPLLPMLQAYSMLAAIEADTGKPDAAIGYGRQALAHAEAHGLPSESPWWINLLTSMAAAELRSGDPRAAEVSIRRAVALVERTLDGKGELASDVYHQLATILRNQHRFGEAIQAVERSIELGGEDSPDRVAIGLDGLAGAWKNYGDYPRAIELFRRSIAVMDAAGIPTDDMSRRRIERNLANCLVPAGRLDEAGPLLQRLREAAIRIEGEDSMEFIFVAWQQMLLAQQRKDAREMERLVRELQPRVHARFPSDHPISGNILLAEAGVAFIRHRLEDAERLQRAGLEILQAREPGGVSAARAQVDLAEIVLARGDRERARALLDEVLPRLRESLLPTEIRRAKAEAMAVALET